MLSRPPRSTLSPYTTLFRSSPEPTKVRDIELFGAAPLGWRAARCTPVRPTARPSPGERAVFAQHIVLLALLLVAQDRKSTRLNSSHMSISYAVFCLKKKK